MDLQALLALVFDKHGAIIDDLENLIGRLHENNEQNNNAEIRALLYEIGLRAPAVALDLFAHLTVENVLPEDEAAPVQPVEAAPVQPVEAVPLTPTSFDGLIQNIENAVQQTKNIKAVGTRHSIEWTDIGHRQQNNGIQIDMSHLKDVIHINRNILNVEYKQQLDNRMICCFEAGATIGHVQDYLWPQEFRKTRYPDRYRILPNQTGCTSLSLSGTIATGAHGNGLTKPIMADMVLSFLLLTVNENRQVERKQIEPVNGITDPESFQVTHPDVTLIQDDDTFKAALVNIGGMGIVYSYILRTEPAYYLTENRYLVNWMQAKEDIQILFDRNINEEEGLEGSLHSFEIFINPYPAIPVVDDHGIPDTAISAVICTLEYTNGPPEGNRPDWHFIPDRWISRAFVLACENFPEIVPLLMDCLMQATTTNQPVTMNAVEAMDPLTGLAVSGQVTLSECAIEISETEDVITPIQALIGLYQRIRREAQNNNQFATSPFAVRFSAASSAYMAMQYVDTVLHNVNPTPRFMMIISNILAGTPGAQNTLLQFRELMQTRFLGRPHWGMVHDIDEFKVNDLYPRAPDEDPVQRFRNVMQEIDPERIFRNDFIERVFPWRPRW